MNVRSFDNLRSKRSYISDFIQSLIRLTSRIILGSSIRLPLTLSSELLVFLRGESEMMERQKSKKESQKC